MGIHYHHKARVRRRIKRRANPLAPKPVVISPPPLPQEDDLTVAAPAVEPVEPVEPPGQRECCLAASCSKCGAEPASLCVRVNPGRPKHSRLPPTEGYLEPILAVHRERLNACPNCS